MYTLMAPSYRCFISNLALICKAVSEKCSFEYYGDISSVHLPICIKFSSSNDILTIFPIQMHGPPMLTLP